MPWKGYRKGASDDKVPSPKRLYVRLPDDVHAALAADTDSRSLTASRILRAVITAHYRHERVRLPHASPNAALLRELCRIGNNLNQLTHEAHLMRLHLLEADARTCLRSLLAAIDRLG